MIWTLLVGAESCWNCFLWSLLILTNSRDGKLNKDDIYKTVSALTDQTEQAEGPESQNKLETEKVNSSELYNCPPTVDSWLVCFTDWSCPECSGRDWSQWLGLHLLGWIQAAGDEITWLQRQFPYQTLSVTRLDYYFPLLYNIHDPDKANSLAVSLLWPVMFPVDLFHLAGGIFPSIIHFVINWPEIKCQEILVFLATWHLKF